MSEELSKKQYKISELETITELSASTIRYWTKEFPQIKTQKNSKGSIYYPVESIQVINQIKHLVKDEKLSIEGAKKFLNSKKNQKDFWDTLEKLKNVRNFLEELKSAIDEV